MWMRSTLYQSTHSACSDRDVHCRMKACGIIIQFHQGMWDGGEYEQHVLVTHSVPMRRCMS